MINEHNLNTQIWIEKRDIYIKSSSKYKIDFTFTCCITILKLAFEFLHLGHTLATLLHASLRACPRKQEDG